jgi:hypothetical protein
MPPNNQHLDLGRCILYGPLSAAVDDRWDQPSEGRGSADLCHDNGCDRPEIALFSLMTLCVPESFTLGDTNLHTLDSETQISSLGRGECDSFRVRAVVLKLNIELL